jgi:hypothetical protein
MQIYTIHINKPNHVFRPGDRQVRKEIEWDYCPQYPGLMSLVDGRESSYPG